MKIDGAIFDIDGTLLDSMPVWQTLGEDYLISRGIKPHENLKEKFKDMSLYEAALYYKSEYGIKDCTETIMAGVNALLADFYKYKAPPKEGAAGFLSELERRHVKMCVATATDAPLVNAALKRCGMLRFFSEIFTCTEVGSGKDKPCIFNAALSFLGTPKSGTWVFEDALYAVETAKAAGFNVAGIYDRFEKNAEAVIKKSDVYIRSFKEAGDLLD